MNPRFTNPWHVSALLLLFGCSPPQKPETQTTGLGFTNEDLISVAMEYQVANGWASSVEEPSTNVGWTVTVKYMMFSEQEAPKFTNWLAWKHPEVYKIYWNNSKAPSQNHSIRLREN